MFGSGTFLNVLLARAFPNVPSARAFSNVLAELALSLLERLLASGPPHSSKRCCTGMLQCCGNPWPAMHAQRVRAQACAPCVSLTAPSLLLLPLLLQVFRLLVTPSSRHLCPT